MNTEYASNSFQIVGAGPAGLAAAITLASAGCRVLVHEAQSHVGHRFGSDLQGLENWSTSDDVLDVLNSMGITTEFSARPCNNGTVFDAWNKRYDVHSAKPLFYLVERGPGAGSLDSALLTQAVGLGVEVRFNSHQTRLVGPGILATGPKAADAIAVGYHFETSLADGFWVILDNAVAPQGYSYLLTMGGRGTVKSCMFSGFNQEKQYVARTVERFKQLVDFEMRNQRPHGGGGNFRLPVSALSGAHLVAGEQAGFQDAFAGFGMRYAILSGVLAARALLTPGIDYDALWRQNMKPAIEISIINRAIYSTMNNRQFRRILRHYAQDDVREILQRLYTPDFLRRLLLPWARYRFHSRRKDASCNHNDCACVWCRHGDLVEIEAAGRTGG